jgi:hypothetical protein
MGKSKNRRGWSLVFDDQTSPTASEGDEGLDQKTVIDDGSLGAELAAALDDPRLKNVAVTTPPSPHRRPRRADGTSARPTVLQHFGGWGTSRDRPTGAAFRPVDGAPGAALAGGHRVDRPLPAGGPRLLDDDPARHLRGAVVARAAAGGRDLAPWWHALGVGSTRQATELR